MRLPPPPPPDPSASIAMTIARLASDAPADAPGPADEHAHWRTLSTWVTAAAARLLGSRCRADAEDVAQDVLLRIARDGTLRQVARAEHPEAYLRAMVRRAVASHARRAGAHARAEHSWWNASPTALDDPWPMVFVRLRADDLLDRLDEADRQLVTLRFFEDRALGDVAERLGLSYDAVAQRLHRLLRRLERASDRG